MSKTVTEIKKNIAGYINVDYPSLDTSEGSPADDIIINPPSQEISKFYDALDTVSEDQSKDTATSQGIDVLLNNVGLTRKSALTSKGTITFFVSAKPTIDISIPLGTLVGTLPSNNTVGIQFLTTQNVTMYVTIISQYYNPSTNKYEVSVPIESVDVGSSNNVGPSTIVSIINSVSGIDGCYNLKSTTGGIDTESDASAITRLEAKWFGGTLGTLGGIYTTINNNSNVLDALVVGNGEAGRDEFGAIDIFVKGQIQTQRTDIVTPIPNAVIPDIIFAKQPVVNDGILSVMSSASGSIPSANYGLLQDTGPYGGSLDSVDSLVWMSPQNSNDHGTVFVTYVYNSLILNLQDIFIQESQNIPEVSILVKQATDIPIDVTCTLQILSGHDITTVQNNVSNALADFFAALTIGQEIQQSDVIGVIIGVDGVDDVKVPLDKFQSSDNLIAQNSSNNLTIPNTSYGSLGALIVQ